MAYLDAFTKLVDDVKQIQPDAKADNVTQSVTMAKPGKLYAKPDVKSTVVRDLDAGHDAVSRPARRRASGGRSPTSWATRAGCRRRCSSWRSATFACGALRPGSDQDLRQRRPGAEGRRSGRRAGRFLRPARPQWRRQDHADRHRHFAGQQDRAARRASSATTSTATSSAPRSCIGVVPQEINFNMFEKPLTSWSTRRASTASRARVALRARREVPEAAAALGQAQRAWRARCPAA